MINDTPSSQNPINELTRLELEAENFALRQNNSELSDQLMEIQHFPYFDNETGDVISIADFQQRY